MNKIPKVLHLYWDGSPLSYLNYLTVPSFLQHHEGYKIKVWTPDHRNEEITWISTEQKTKYIGKDYFYLLKTHPEVEILTMEFAKLNLSDDVSEVHKSDFFRLYILSTEGGIWSDFDILYFDNMTKIFNDIGVPENADAILFELDTFMNYFPVGLLISSGNNALYRYILTVAKKQYNPADYQTAGANLLKRIGKDKLSSFKNTLTVFVSGKVYLPLECVHLKYLFFEDVSHILKERIGENIFGLHWFNGSAEAKNYLNNFNLLIHFNTTVSTYAKNTIRWLIQTFPQVPEHTAYNIE